MKDHADYAAIVASDGADLMSKSPTDRKPIPANEGIRSQAPDEKPGRLHGKAAALVNPWKH